MFIFSFQSQEKYLIKHIVISGRFLTIYPEKENTIEMQPTISHLKLSSHIISEDPLHHFLHNEFVGFSRKGDSVPHKHLQFHLKNRLQALKEICQHFLERQQNLELRKTDHIKLCAALNEERIAYGHQAFPSSIRKSIDAFDPEIPFFPEDELEDLYAQFKAYIHSDGLLKMAENLGSYADKLLISNWERCFLKTEGENTFFDDSTTHYYQKIIHLRHLTLKIHAENKLKDHAHANKIARFLLNNTATINSNIFNNSLKRIITITASSTRWHNLIDITATTISYALLSATGALFREVLVNKILPTENSSSDNAGPSTASFILASTIVGFGFNEVLFFRKNKQEEQENQKIMLEELEQGQEQKLQDMRCSSPRLNKAT